MLCLVQLIFQLSDLFAQLFHIWTCRGQLLGNRLTGLLDAVGHAVHSFEPGYSIVFSFHFRFFKV